MIYFCENCKSFFEEEEAGEFIESHPEVAEFGYIPEEVWLCCPFCDSEDVSEASECPVCGEPIQSSEDYCKSCTEKMNTIITEVEERIEAQYGEKMMECFKDMLVERYF